MQRPFKQLADALEGDWVSVARPEQLPPPGAWHIWLLLGGRGAGKTRTLAEWVRSQVETGAAGRIALVAPTANDVRKVVVEGESGILATAPNWNRPIFEPANRQLTWPNGAIATLYSADEPERLRGPQHDAAACDELASWRRPEAWAMLMFGLRLGNNPRCIVATTPKPVKLVRDLVAREGKDVVITRSRTQDNRVNLAPQFLDQITARYGGTRLGRQELNGELLEDTPGALWTRDMLDQTRVETAPPLSRVVVAIDPAGSSAEGADETGIVVAGLGQDGHGYALSDFSGRFAPTDWAKAAIGQYHFRKADRIVGESNYGGDMVEATVRAVDPNVSFKLIHSSRGKVLRAEPIAAFFEQRRAHLIGTFPELEDQLCQFSTNWSRSRDGSPGRLDALVFALTELMGDASNFEAWMEYVKQDAAKAAGQPLPDPAADDILAIYEKTFREAEAQGVRQSDELDSCGFPIPSAPGRLCCGICGKSLQPGARYIEINGERRHELCHQRRM